MINQERSSINFKYNNSKYDFVNKLLVIPRNLLQSKIYSFDELILLNNELPFMIFEYVEWYYLNYGKHNLTKLETNTWAPRFSDDFSSYNNTLAHNIWETIELFINLNLPKYHDLYEYLETIDPKIHHSIFATIGNLMYLKEFTSDKYNSNEIITKIINQYAG